MSDVGRAYRRGYCCGARTVTVGAVVMHVLGVSQFAFELGVAHGQALARWLQ